MKKILAFAGSNHAASINQQLVAYTASLMTDFDVTVINIHDWKIPVYSIDMDPDQTPDEIVKLLELIKEYDAFVLSTPEHNGTVSAFLKNIIDWISRRSKKVFEEKPLLLMSTSPGAGGAANSRKAVEKLLPYQGAQIVATFSLPSFKTNFVEGAVSEEYQEELREAIAQFTTALQTA